MKTVCPSSYHNNDFVATDTLGRIIYGYTLLVLLNQRVLNKLSKEPYINGQKSFMTHRVLKSARVLESYTTCLTC